MRSTHCASDDRILLFEDSYIINTDDVSDCDGE